MNDPAGTAWDGVILWTLIAVLWTAVPVIVIVMAINGVRSEIRQLVDALKNLDREDEPSGS
jgi:hypothetical protein